MKITWRDDRMFVNIFEVNLVNRKKSQRAICCTIENINFWRGCFREWRQNKVNYHKIPNGSKNLIKKFRKFSRNYEKSYAY